MATAREILCERVEPAQIRACSVWDVMKGFGAVLHNNVVLTQEMHDNMSRAIESIDDFISHSWRQPRSRKFLGLALVYNFPAAVVAAALGGLLGFVLHLTDVLPNPQGAIAMDDAGEPTGYGALVLGNMMFVLTLVCWGELMHLWCSGSAPRVFFDKYCINQADLEAKQQGIKSLGGTIAHSKRLVILLSHSYFTRLWTVFEIACFMSVHTSDCLVFMSEAIPKVLIITLVLFLCVKLTYNASLLLLYYFGGVWATRIWAILLAICCIVAIASVLIILRGAAEESASLQRVLGAFTIQATECHDESDRMLVQGHVALLELSLRKDQPEHLSEGQALESFNARVQEELASAVLLNLGRHCLPYRVMVACAISNSLDGMDTLAVALKGGAVRYGVLNFLTGLEQTFLSFPLMTVFMNSLAARRLDMRQGRFRELVLVAVSSMVALPVVFIFIGLPVLLKRLAYESDVYAVIWCAWVFLELVTTLCLFR